MGWFPLLFDVVAYPVHPNTEPFAANATLPQFVHQGVIPNNFCFKVTACDPTHGYGARTFYFIGKDSEQSTRIIQAINFNAVTVQLCPSRC